MVKVSNVIIVYWGCIENEWMRSSSPVHIIKNVMSDDRIKDIDLNRCPSFQDHMKNIYGLKSLYDYTFTVDNNDVKSDDYNQVFFDAHVETRSIKNKCFSFKQKYIFITEEKSLNMSVGIAPFFEDNEILKRCSIIPGTLDIGKWFRMIDFAFFLKKDFDTFVIKEEDIFQYIQFHTDKKIVFKQFFINDNIDRQILSVDHARSNRNKKFRSLDNYYGMFKNKKNIIKEIKNNIID